MLTSYSIAVLLYLEGPDQNPTAGAHRSARFVLLTSAEGYDTILASKLGG